MLGTEGFYFYRAHQMSRRNKGSDFLFFLEIPGLKHMAHGWLMPERKARRILFCDIIWRMDVRRMDGRGSRFLGVTLSLPLQPPSGREYCSFVRMSAQLTRHMIFLFQPSTYPAMERNVSPWFNWAGTWIFPRIHLRAPNFESQAKSRDCWRSSLEWWSSINSLGSSLSSFILHAIIFLWRAHISTSPLLKSSTSTAISEDFNLFKIFF